MTHDGSKIDIKYEFKLGTNLASNISPMWYKTLKYSYDTTETELNLKFELAGKTKENVKVYNNEDSINIKIDDKQTYCIDLNPFYAVEEYDIDSSKATLKHGLLNIAIPKKKRKQKEIEID